MKIIEFKDVWFKYPDGTPALKGIDLSIEKGKKIAFLGENGSGKSTLFLAFNGIHKIDKGEYFFEGEKINYSKGHRRNLIRNIGLVFQDPDVQLFASTVYQEISFGPKNLGFTDNETAQKVECSMKKADVAHLKYRPTHFLSYGEKKRVSIADILAMDSGIIIFDEPLAWLDARHSEKVTKILSELNANKTTVIISTHDSDLAYSWADYIFIMKEGSIIGRGEPEEIFLNDILLEKANLRIPFILEISQKLGLKKIPRDKNELFELIDPR